MNLAELLVIPATEFPEQEILTFDDRRWTYHGLLDFVERTAGALREFGVRSGDRVAVLDTNSPALLALLYAAPLIGATVVPLNYRARAEELGHMLQVAQPRLLFAAERYLEVARAAISLVTDVAVRVLALEGPEQTLASAVETVEPEPSDGVLDDSGVAALLFTSGTTAHPKGVMLGHEDLTGYVLVNTELATGEDSGTLLVAVPLYHIAGVTSVLNATFGGRRIVLMRQFEAGEWLHCVQQERVTHAFLVPTMLKRVLDHPEFETTDLSSLRSVSYGAAPMPLSVIRRAIEAFPRHVDFVNAFGQTETTATVCVLGSEDHRLEGSTEEIETRLRRLASVGRPLPDVQIRILDDDGRPLAAGQVGEIAVRTGRSMRGYYGQAEATANTLREGWLLTRDLGWVDDGGYLFLAGRKSDTIIRGGENIAPQEVEVVLASHPAVEDVAVFGVPDTEWGETVAAAVVPRAGADVTPEELIAFSRERLASFKKPERVIFLDELPHSSVGKILRRELVTLVSQ